MNLSKTFLIASSLLTAGISGTALAATDTVQFQVRLVITESCDIQTVAATDMDFLTHARSEHGPVDAEGSLVVNCSAGTPYTIGLDAGANSTTATASADNRRMISDNGDFLPYGLYRDAGRTLFWGDVIGADTLAGTGSGSAESIPVYGRVLSINAPAGTYADTVTATITY
jgi:spore coat protein U-like protein